MFGPGRATRIYLAAGVTDMRMGFDERRAISRATARRAFRDSGRGKSSIAENDADSSPRRYGHSEGHLQFCPMIFAIRSAKQSASIDGG